MVDKDSNSFKKNCFETGKTYLDVGTLGGVEACLGNNHKESVVGGYVLRKEALDSFLLHIC